MKITDLTCSYESKRIYDNFCLELDDKKVTALLGLSGVGKTTFLNIVAGITPYTGTVEGAGRISYMFQESRLIPTLTVKENLLYIAGEENSSDKIDRLLNMAGLEGERDSFSHELSGGMASRVSLVRAFLKESDTLLMDEPLRSLDGVTASKIRELIKSFLIEYPRTVLLVTHDTREAIELSDRILVLKDNPVTIYKDIRVAGDLTEDQRYSIERDILSSI